MLAHIHTPATPLPRPNAPVLLERGRAIDTRLVRPRRLQDLVGAAVGRDAAFYRGGGRRIVGAEVLDYVVFYQGVARPAVDGEVRVSCWSVGCGVGYYAAITYNISVSVSVQVRYGMVWYCSEAGKTKRT